MNLHNTHFRSFSKSIKSKQGESYSLVDIKVFYQKIERKFKIRNRQKGKNLIEFMFTEQTWLNSPCTAWSKKNDLWTNRQLNRKLLHAPLSGPACQKQSQVNEKGFRLCTSALKRSFSWFDCSGGNILTGPIQITVSVVHARLNEIIRK